MFTLFYYLIVTQNLNKQYNNDFLNPLVKLKNFIISVSNNNPTNNTLSN